MINKELDVENVMAQLVWRGFPFVSAAPLVVSFFFGLANGGCNRTGSTPQKMAEKGVVCDSIDDFINQWSDAYDQGDTQHIEKLILPSDIPAQCIRDSIAILTTYSGRHRVVNSGYVAYEGKIKPCQCEGNEYFAHPIPSWIVTIDTEGHEGYEGATSKFSTSFAVGKLQDGRFGIVLGEYMTP
jgi:hypothetical protein